MDWDEGSLNDIVLFNTIVTIAQLNVNSSIKIKNLNLVTYMEWKNLFNMDSGFKTIHV